MTLDSADSALPSPTPSEVLALMGELVFELDDPHDLVDATRTVLLRLFSPKTVAFGLSSDDEAMVVLAANSEESVAEPVVLPLEGSLVGEVLASRRLGVFLEGEGGDRERLETDPAFAGGPLLIAPLIGQGLGLGVLEVSWGAGAPAPTAEQRALLSAVAGIVGNALVKLHRRQAERRHASSVDARLKQGAQAAGLGSMPFAGLLDELREALMTRAVLVRGEPGSGKEVLVREACDALELPLRVLRCHGREEAELRRTLFGEGQTPGWLEESVGGVLLIDEGALLPPALQKELVGLVRDLQVRREGDETPRFSDARLVIATRRDPRALDEELVSACEKTVVVPALREAPDDVVEIAEELLAGLCRELSRGPSRVSPEVAEELRTHGWPGNLRELRCVLEIAASFASGDLLEVEDLALAWGRVKPPVALEVDESLPLSSAVAAFKQKRIERALARTNGNQTRAAELLGVRQPNLSRLMATLGMRSRRRET